jgi:HTH-type transcriptional regulator/antitoxin HigA
MQPRALHTETDYDRALKVIERYFEQEPAPGSHDASRFDLLAIAIAAYEGRHWPIDMKDSESGIAAKR